MSDKSPRNLANILRSAFSFEEVSPVYNLNIDGRVVPVSTESVENRSNTLENHPSEDNSSSDNSSSNMSSMALATPPGTSVTINGQVINTLSLAQVVIMGITPLFKKESQILLSEYK
jgi:hypothetical protein